MKPAAEQNNMAQRTLQLESPSDKDKEEAIKSLVEQFYTPLCVYCVQFTDSLEVAEDIVQDLFLRLWEKNHLIMIKGSIKAYLFNAVRNMSIDYLRREHLLVPTDPEEVWYVTEDEVDEETLTQQRNRLHAYLQQLSPREYRVLTEVVINSKRYKEVATELGISVNTVKTHLARALSFLRKQHLLQSLLLITIH